MADLCKKRARDDLDELDSPEVKRLREDLLGLLDDPDPDPATQDLDFIIKSLEEEISPSTSVSPRVPVVDLTSDSGDSRVKLGYLLEASDDELGLPPSVSPSGVEVKKVEKETEFVRVSSELSGIGELWGLEDCYSSFEFGNGNNYNGNSSSEYVELGGLFDNYDLSLDSSENSRRHETLPAV